LVDPSDRTIEDILAWEICGLPPRTA